MTTLNPRQCLYTEWMGQYQKVVRLLKRKQQKDIERKKERKKKKSFERTRSQMGKVGIVQRRSGHPSQKREDRYSKYATGIYTTDKTCPSCLSISSICLMVHIDQPDTSLLFSAAAAAQLA